MWMPVLICLATMNGGECTLYDNLANISRYSHNLYSSRSACERAGASAVRKWSKDGGSYSYYCLDITSPSPPPPVPASRFQPAATPGPAAGATVPQPPTRPASQASAVAESPPASATRSGPPPRRTAPPAADAASVAPADSVTAPAAATSPHPIAAPAVAVPSPQAGPATAEIEVLPPTSSLEPEVAPESAPPAILPAPVERLMPPQSADAAPAASPARVDDRTPPAEPTAAESAAIAEAPAEEGSSPPTEANVPTTGGSPSAMATATVAPEGQAPPSLPVDETPPSAPVSGQGAAGEPIGPKPLPEPPASAPPVAEPAVGDGPEHAPAEATGADAPHYLPWFITAPGDTDYLFNAMAALVIAAIIAIGNLFFKLHALPERWAHSANPLQIEIVAVLSLIGLFTHQHVFWIAALLLAMVRIPDFATPIRSMSDSLAALARRNSRAPGREGSAPVPTPDRTGGGA